jgi:hypothetical protein
MYKNDTFAVSSIGTGCMVEHQIQHRFNSSVGGFFNYITITPEALIQILKIYEKDQNFNFLIKSNNYISVKVNKRFEKRYMPFHKDIKGLVLYHDSLNDTMSFESKKTHQFNNFDFNKKNIFIWSNLQSNIWQVSRELKLKVEDFYLTQDRYNKISKLIEKNWKGQCIFIVREEYCDKSVLFEKNVHVLELTNYKYFTKNLHHLGPEKFFNSIIDQYIL